MGRSIELWTYRLFSSRALYLEEVLQKSVAFGPPEPLKNPTMVSAGKKAAATRALGGWTFDQHLEGKPEQIRSIILAIQEYMLGPAPAMEEAPKKLYIAYRTTQNIVCLEAQKQKILLRLGVGKAVHEVGLRASRRLIRRLSNARGTLNFGISRHGHL